MSFGLISSDIFFVWNTFCAGGSLKRYGYPSQIRTLGFVWLVLGEDGIQFSVPNHKLNKTLFGLGEKRKRERKKKTSHIPRWKQESLIKPAPVNGMEMIKKHKNCTTGTVKASHWFVKNNTYIFCSVFFLCWNFIWLLFFFLWCCPLTVPPPPHPTPKKSFKAVFWCRVYLKFLHQ